MHIRFVLRGACYGAIVNLFKSAFGGARCWTASPALLANDADDARHAVDVKRRK